MSDIACFINIFSTDPVTKILGKGRWCQFSFAMVPVGQGSAEKVHPRFLVLFSFKFNFQYIYIASAKYSDSPNFVEFFVCHGPIILRQVSVAFKVLQ